MTKLLDIQPSKHNKIVYGILFVLLIMIFVVLESTIWINRAFFNTTTFSNTVTTSLTSESSRNAIASEVVTQALEDRPIARRVVGDQLTGFISSALGSSIANDSLLKLSEKIQLYLTTEDQQSVTLDFTGIKDTTEKFLTVIQRDSTENPVSIDKVPDTITLVDANKIPSFYATSRFFMWTTPVLLIGACVIFFTLYLKHRKNISYTLYAISAALIISTLVGLLFGPLFRPPVLTSANTISGRIVVGNLYDSFMGIFSQQLVTTLGFGILIIVITASIKNYRRIVSLSKKK